MLYKSLGILNKAQVIEIIEPNYCLLKNHAQKKSLQFGHTQKEVSLMELNPSWLRNHEG